MGRFMGIISTPRKLKFLWLALSLLGSVFCAHYAHAASATGIFADDACDPDYYESLKARAWLEAQREITQNQNLIFKPDSVLEYTCFDKQMGVMSQQAENMFSESDEWGGHASTDMQDALSGLSGNSADDYLTSNFDHNLLGGRMDSGYDFDSSAAPSGYSCDVMDRVWMYAKCMDFIHKDHDGFFTFAEMNADDKRKLPDPCSGGAPYQDNLDLAFNEAETPWIEDNMRTYLDNIYPTSGCGGAASRIPTGTTVYTSQGGINEFQEHACLVPGCHYQPSGASAGTCVAP